MKRILLLFLCMTLVAFNCFASPEYKMVKSQGDVLGRWLEIESIIDDYFGSDYYTEDINHTTYYYRDLEIRIQIIVCERCLSVFEFEQFITNKIYNQ